MLKNLLLIIGVLLTTLSAKAQTPQDLALAISQESVQKLNHPNRIEFRTVDTQIDSFHQFDFVNENWNDTPLGRAFYSYDNDGNNTRIEFLELDPATNEYELTQIVDQVYSGSLIDSVYINVLDEASGDFITQLIQANTYNEDDLVETQWLQIDFGFILIYAQSTFYYSENNLLDSLKQDISFDNVAFDPNATVVYSYDAEENQVESLTTVINQMGMVENNSRDSSAYDEYNRRTKYYTWEWDVNTSQWVPEQIVTFENDEYGTPMIEYQKVYDSAVGAFLNQLKTVYFFNYLSSVDETSLLDCRMLNPSQGLIQINCPELQEYDQVNLQVFDMMGRLVMAKNIVNNENISFESGLQSGTYIVFLSSENYPLISEKLIIR